MSVTTGSSVWTGDRCKLVLGKLLKSGGAGSVYLMPESPLQVAKIYHDSSDRAEYEHEVAAMLELSPHLPDLVENGKRYVQIAWPQALLRDDRGHFLGFLMPAVDVQSTSELECILQERQARAAHLPTGMGAKVTLAANLAAVIAALHQQGHHVIDLKPVNLRFYPQALYMAMLDCDGFSIQGRGERYAADQITPDYLAPEFQGKPLPDGGETQQDLFALAVVIFQLLNFGIHPFTGRPNSEHVPTDIPGRIAQRCYAYGIHANAGLGPSPVSGHRSMPSDLRLLFDRAFESAGTTRPSANEWVVLLKGYALRSSHLLRVCSIDHQHQHFAGLPCAACARVALIESTARSAVAAKAAASPLNVMTRAIGMRAPRVPLAYPAQPAMRLQPRSWKRLSPMPPRPPRPSPTVWWAGGVPWRVLFFVCWMIFVAASTCGRAPRHDPRTSDAPLPAASPESLEELRSKSPPEPRHEPSPVPSVGDDVTESSMAVDLDPVRRSVDVAAEAMVQGNPEAAKAILADLSRTAAGHPSPTGDAYRAEFEQFSASLSGHVYDDKLRSGLMRNLQIVLENDRYDGEAAYELGWLALLGGDSSAASDWFVHAIWAKPDLAAAWYGMGITTTVDDEIVGSLAVAEMLSPNPASAQRMRDGFPAQLIERSGNMLERFVYLQARARLIASHSTGRKLPPDIRALARKPLPVF